MAGPFAFHWIECPFAFAFNKSKIVQQLIRSLPSLHSIKASIVNTITVHTMYHSKYGSSMPFFKLVSVRFLFIKRENVSFFLLFEIKDLCLCLAFVITHFAIQK